MFSDIETNIAILLQNAVIFILCCYDPFHDWSMFQTYNRLHYMGQSFTESERELDVGSFSSKYYFLLAIMQQPAIRVQDTIREAA
jgi:hypothetical protein